MTDLAALTGSEKQIAWATKIRADALAFKGNAIIPVPTEFTPAQIEAAAKKGVSADALKTLFAGILAAQIEARETLVNQTSAAWWIDNKGTCTTVVYKTYHREFAALRSKL